MEIHFLFCGFKDYDTLQPIIYQCLAIGKKIENEEVVINNEITLKNASTNFGVFAIGKDSYIEDFLSDKNLGSSKN